MYSVILSKKLNNTELGFTGIHEKYILVPADLDVSDLFEQTNSEKSFYSARTRKSYELRYTEGREKRIVGGLGRFYKDVAASAGDEVTLERRVGTEELYFISIKQNPNTVAIQKVKHGFEILNPERLTLISENSKIVIGDETKKFSFYYIGDTKKRTDSKVETKLYDMQIDGASIAGEYSSDDLIELNVQGNEVRIMKFYGWKKITIGGLEHE